MVGRRRRWIKWLVAALVLVWVAAAAVLALLGVAAADRGQQALDRAQRDRTYEALTDPATGALLDDAHDEFARGNRLLANPVMFPFRFLPVLGRQLRSADRLTQNAADASEVARDTVDEVREMSEGPTPQGPERLRLLGRLATVVDDAHRRLEAIDIPDDEALIGPVDDVRTTLADKRGEAVDGLDRASKVLGSLQSLLDGETYLVWGANNAEMRAGSGMFLSATTLTTEGGHLDIGDVRPTNRLVLDEGVETPPELSRNYPWLDTGNDFRNLALSPRFAQSAEIASRMWPQVPEGEEVDGVLAVDAEALWHIMKVTGPVTVNGTTYTPKTVRYQLLNGQYKQFPKDQGDRTDQLGEVARAVFDELESGDWKVGKLATALIDSVAGRHLLMWSADEAEQAGWEAASADGGLEEESLAVSVLSRGANKLDYYLGVGAAITTTASTTGTEVYVDISLRNRTPAKGDPKYVVGPNIEGLAEGEYAGIVVVNVPKAARSVRFEGGAYSTLAGTDGPTQTQGRYLRILRGDQARLTLRFRLPASADHLVIEPSARVGPLRWTFDGHEFVVEKRRTVELGDSP
jgi:hypothetical protein